MYCSQLSGMKKLDDESRKKINCFFDSIRSNEYITISRCQRETGINERVVADVFSDLYTNGHLEMTYAAMCPECGHLIKKLDSLETSTLQKIKDCYSCDEEIEITEADVIVLFNKKSKFPFGNGQHLMNVTGIRKEDVAPLDTVNHLSDINDTLRMFLKFETERNKAKKEADEKNANVKERVYTVYNKRRKKYIYLKTITLILSIAMLFFVLIVTKANGSAAVLITVIIYIFQNAVDIVLSLFINTNYDYIEKEILYKKNAT